MKYFLLAINEAKVRATATAEGIRTHLVGTGSKYYGAVMVNELKGDPIAELSELRLLTERLGQELDVLRAAYANCNAKSESA